MLDNMFSIKEASKLLDCSTQNIYQQKSKLMELGLMEQSNTGAFVLNEKGINYLREKRAETIKSNSQGFNQVVNKDLSSIATSSNYSNVDDYIKILKEQIEDLKSDRDFWKQEYTKKDIELKDKNIYIQEINTKAFALLGTAEQNKKQEEETKKGFWKKIFG